MATTDTSSKPPTIGSMPGKYNPGHVLPGTGTKQPKPLPMPTVPGSGRKQIPRKGGSLPKSSNNLAEIARKRLQKMGG